MHKSHYQLQYNYNEVQFIGIITNTITKSKIVNAMAFLVIIVID